MKTLTFQKGAVIVAEGDTGNSMFLILRGSVGVYGDYGKSGERKLMELHKDDNFGELAFFESEVRTATVAALEDGTELKEISAGEFDDFLQEHPEFAKRVMMQMSRRIRDLTGAYLEACRTVADIQEVEKSGAEKTPELNSRMDQVVDIYKNRFPALFNITMKEAKDDVHFVFSARK